MSSTIKDESGNEMIYWPMAGLVEGEQSQTITIKVDCPQEGNLISEADSRLKIMGRRKGIGSFVDLAEGGISLRTLSGEQEFEIYGEAMSPQTGLSRIPVSVIASRRSAADWKG